MGIVLCTHSVIRDLRADDSVRQAQATDAADGADTTASDATAAQDERLLRDHLSHIVRTYGPARGLGETPDSCLYLDVHDELLFQNRIRGGTLFRELPRQALLIAARDELGLSTRDRALREEFPWSDEPVHWPMSVVTTVTDSGRGIVSVFRRTADGLDVLWEKRFSLADGEASSQLAAIMEEVSRTEFVDLLKGQGYAAARPDAVETGSVPDDVAELLETFDVIGQFDAVRRLHAIIRTDGESPERLAALSRAYAQLSVLSSGFHAAMEKVCSARALLYAERLVYRTKSSTDALRNRALVRAFCGLPDLAFEDLQQAGGDDEPDWEEAVRAYCTGDVGKLEQLAAAADPTDITLYFACMAQANRTDDTVRYQAIANMLQHQPDCVRLMFSLAEIRSLGTKRIAMTTLDYVPSVIGRHLPHVPGLPADALNALRAPDEMQNADVVAVIDTLKSHGTPAEDPEEPSLDALGQVLREMQFTAAWQSLDFLDNWLDVPVEEHVRHITPLVENHPNGPLLISRGTQGEESNHTPSEYLAPVDEPMLTRRDVELIRRIPSIDARTRRHLQGVCFEHADEVVPEIFWKINYLRGTPYEQDVLRKAVRIASGLVTTREWQLYRTPDSVADRMAEWEQTYANDASMQKALAVVYRGRGDVESSRRCIERWISVAPSYDAYQELANVYDMQRDDEHWLAALETSLQYPVPGLEHGRTRNRIARHFLDHGDPERALKYAEGAARTGAAWAMIGAAEVHEKLDNWDEAEAYIRATSMRYRGQSMRWFFWCVRTGHGDVDSAQQVAEQYLKSFGPEVPEDNREDAAMFYLLTDQPEKAYELLVWLARDDGDAYYDWHAFTLAVVRDDDAVRDEMLQSIVKADQQGDESRIPHTGRIAQHIQQQIAAGAPASLDLDFLDRSIARLGGGGPPNMWYFLGQYLIKYGREDDGMEYLRRAAADPDGTLWTNWFARFILRGLHEKPPERRLYSRIYPDSVLQHPEWVTVLQHPAPLTGVAFVGESIVTNDWGGTIRVWSGDPPAVQHEIPIAAALSGWSPDASRLVVLPYTRDGLQWWIPGEDRPEHVYPGVGPITSGGAYFPGDSDTMLWIGQQRKSDTMPGNLLARVRLDDNTELWRADLGDFHIAGVKRSEAYDAICVFGRTESGKGLVKIVSGTDGTIMETRELPHHPPASLWRSDDERIAATRSDEGEVVVWDITDVTVRKRLWLPRAITGRLVHGAARLIVGRDDGLIEIIDLDQDRVIARHEGHGQSVVKVEVDDASERFVTVSYDHTARIWDLARFEKEFAVSDDAPVSVYVNFAGMSMTPIPPGEFEMGERDRFQLTPGYQRSHLAFERPRHQVRITQPFYISQHEVTVGQFRQFVEETQYVTVAERGKGGYHLIPPEADWKPRPEYNWRHPGFEQTDQHPVVHICYDDAVAFCDWLSRKEGRTYRLPTEAEWEYACRGNTVTSWVGGNEPSDVFGYGNVADISIRKFYNFFGTAWSSSDGYPFTAPVGSYKANPFGCYDMHGNVFEWCRDYYDGHYYARSPVDDPTGPASGTDRVLRSGSFLNHADDSRSAHRESSEPDSTASNTGFRPVLEVGS